MKTATTAILAALFASACAAAPARPEASADREVLFSCGNGESLTVRFSASQETATLIRNGQSIELKQQPSGSGFVYGNGRNTIRGKGDDLTVEIGRMVPIQCKAR